MDEPTLAIEDIVGKTILIGITRTDRDDKVIGQHQYVGTCIAVEELVHITLSGGEDFTLPPDPSAFRKAQPGTYRLRSTGEEVEDPDFLTTWIVQEPAPEDR